MSNQIRGTLRIICRRTASRILRGSARQVLGLLYRRASILVAVPRFRRLARAIEDIEGIVGFAFSFRQYGISIAPLQVREEVLEFLRLVKKEKPKMILEIGTARGGTLFMLSRMADPSATIISLDLPGGAFGGGYPKWKLPLYRSFAKSRQDIRFLRVNSHDVETLNKIVEIKGDSRFDLLFIDGDHSYNGIKMDFEMYSPLVRKGGIVAFHDIVPHDKFHDPLGEIGVDRFWREVKKNHRNHEIVKNRKQGWAGIGVLYL